MKNQKLLLVLGALIALFVFFKDKLMYSEGSADTKNFKNSSTTTESPVRPRTKPLVRIDDTPHAVPKPLKPIDNIINDSNCKGACSTTRPMVTDRPRLGRPQILAPRKELAIR